MTDLLGRILAQSKILRYLEPGAAGSGCKYTNYCASLMLTKVIKGLSIRLSECCLENRMAKLKKTCWL